MVKAKAEAAEAVAAAPAAPKDPVLNEHGEMLLPLGGELYALRPSRKAIDRVEQQLRPLFQLANDADRAALSLSEMAIISAEFMRAYAEANPEEKGVIARPDLDRLEDLIYDTGMTRVAARLMVVLSGAVNGGYVPTGEVKAGTATSQ